MEGGDKKDLPPLRLGRGGSSTSSSTTRSSTRSGRRRRSSRRREEIYAVWWCESRGPKRIAKLIFLGLKKVQKYVTKWVTWLGALLGNNDRFQWLMNYIEVSKLRDA